MRHGHISRIAHIVARTLGRNFGAAGRIMPGERRSPDMNGGRLSQGRPRHERTGCLSVMGGNQARTASLSLSQARGPDGLRLYAIGDIHGRRDLLEQMHALVDEDIRRAGAADWRVIYLGDYVDRGPDSRGVLDILASLRGDPRRVMLAGNHDAAFLAFLDKPDLRGVFANNGGAETARSYGVDMNFRDYADDPDALLRDHARLVATLPGVHRQFLEGLPHCISFGDFFFCHAGVRPGVALDRQSPDDLMWIRAPFLETDQLFAKVIVHGHTISPGPVTRANRIGIDTGAVKTGRLTALIIQGGQRAFLST